MVYHTVYRIINTVNGKTYIGAHTTQNLNDGYMGSGIAIKRAIKKYGRSAFTKDILCVFFNEDSMYEYERELITLGPESYNMVIGGNGGWSYARAHVTEESNNKRRATQNSVEYKLRTLSARQASSNRMKQQNPMHDKAIVEANVAAKLKTYNNEQWQETVGAQRRDKISTTMKKRAAEGAFQSTERCNKIAEARKGLKRATHNGKKVWLADNDERWLDLNTTKGW